MFSGIGLLKGYEVDLILTKDIEFFNRPPIVPIHLRDTATERLHTFVKQGLFEFVTPGQPIKYSSSLLVIDEGKGEEIKLRLCGDYRYVNQFIAQTSKVPMQKLEDYLDKMTGAKYFPRTDCKRILAISFKQTFTRNFYTIKAHW